MRRWVCWRKSRECSMRPFEVMLVLLRGGFRESSRVGALPARPLTFPAPRCRFSLGLRELFPVTADDQPLTTTWTGKRDESVPAQHRCRQGCRHLGVGFIQWRIVRRTKDSGDWCLVGVTSLFCGPMGMRSLWLSCY